MTVPSEVLPPPATRSLGSWRKFAQLAQMVDRKPELVLPIWLAAFLAVLWRASQRPLWFDELFTYYIAMSPTYDRFAGSILHTDLNPPLNYLFVRVCIILFGDSPFVTRIPPILGFVTAGFVVFHLVTRRLGGGFGLLALGTLWSLSMTSYAVEARPYGLLLGFFSVAALCWVNCAETDRLSKWHAGLAAAIAGMLLSHCFSVVFIAALGTGELVRTIASKRIDKKVWSALLAPMCLLPLYVPLLRTKRGLVFPFAYRATPVTVANFYIWILTPLLPVVALLLVGWMAGRRKQPVIHWRDLGAPHELAFALATLCAPALIAGYCIANRMPFWGRYGVGATLGLCLILTSFLAIVLKRSSVGAVAAAGLVLLLFCFTKAGTGRLNEDFEGVSSAYRTIHPELPFVASCGQTFLEMDHRESAEFGRRLFYLTDKESDLHYIGSNLFEEYPAYQHWFPIRATVSSYPEFVKHNQQFLVLAKPDCRVEWLLLKLRDDGAQIHLLKEMKTGYQDHFLYEVTMRS